MAAPLDEAAAMLVRRVFLLRKRSGRSDSRRRSLGWNSTVGLSRTTVRADVKLTEELLRAVGFVAPKDASVRMVGADVTFVVDVVDDVTDDPATNHGKWTGGRIKGDVSVLRNSLLLAGDGNLGCTVEGVLWEVYLRRRRVRLPLCLRLRTLPPPLLVTVQTTPQLLSPLLSAG